MEVAAARVSFSSMSAGEQADIYEGVGEGGGARRRRRCRGGGDGGFGKLRRLRTRGAGGGGKQTAPTHTLFFLFTLTHLRTFTRLFFLVPIF